MTIELKKRIITSNILAALVIFSIFSHLVIFIIATLIISYFAFNEISFINFRILKNNSLFLNTLCLLYVLRKNKI